VKRKENVYNGAVKDKGNTKSQRNNYLAPANYGNVSASSPDRVIVPRLVNSKDIYGKGKYIYTKIL
jgi:hypothetical protein